MTLKARAWFIGEGSLLVRCAELYLRAGHRILGIVSSDSAVRRFASSEQLIVVDPSTPFSEKIHQAPFDHLFSIVNLTRLDVDIISAPRLAAVNFHDGPLPAYAGLNAPVWALLAGEGQYGVTWHEMTATVDAGRILAQQLFDVPEGETSFGLNARCYEAGLQSFSQLIEQLTHGRVSPREQDLTKRTSFRRHDRPVSGGLIQWDRPAAELARLVQALDFGPYPNTFGSPRLLTRGGPFLIGGVEVDGRPAQNAPGTIEEASTAKVVVATTSSSLTITSVRRVTGEVTALGDFVREAALRQGDDLHAATRDARETLAPWVADAPRHEAYWLERLVALEPLVIPRTKDRGAGGDPVTRLRSTIEFPEDAMGALGIGPVDSGGSLLGLAAIYLARLANAAFATLPFTEPRLAPLRANAVPLISDVRPVHVDLRHSWRSFAAHLADQAAESADRGSFFVDVCARYPGHTALKAFAEWRRHVVFVLSASPDRHQASPETTLELITGLDGRTLVWDADSRAFPADLLEQMQTELLGFVQELARDPQRSLDTLPLVDARERERLVHQWNRTDVPVDPACVHELIERQAAAGPDRVALVCRDRALDYARLNARVNQLAHYLRRMGVGPDVRVGLCLDRSLDLVVSLLAILKAGGAYVPLDPTYPRERLAFITRDAALAIVITEQRLAIDFPGCRVVCPGRDDAAIGREPASNPAHVALPSNLAYVIYTSGSTGNPKGVMIEHRNVANFLVAMDAPLAGALGGVWLSVTSVSFDISVLELLWTLARGFSVVLYTGEPETAAAHPARSTSTQPLDFSLFYFSADESSEGRDKYRLLLEGAKFADTHDFSAVWTPERHFHAFGGLYPNPAVTGAAIAAITSRVKVRAGSCVLPLHHPIRVAEEWSVVDNLSNGRVGIAFASGWQPNDFILRPESYADRKAVLMREIATVQALWRGEAIEWTTPTGATHAVRTMPRPVQPTLPTWITAAGNPETFAAAGSAGTGILTHLLGQTVDELATKVAAYREARRESGHAGNGHVVLMLHTLVSDSDEQVREIVREPLTKYLRTSLDLIKPFAESFPTFTARAGDQSLSAVLTSLTEADYDALVAHSFERYFETSGLFGRPETCLPLIDRLKAIGVDEVACLVDFGVATDTVLENLQHLNRLRELSEAAAVEQDFSIPALIGRHAVTHFQCTPSMARMLLLDPATRVGLSRLEAFLIGGEALPPSLASDLEAAMPSTALWNMYGPTETTVWSTTWQVRASETISIGRPVANTRIYILDDALEPVPVGLPGHLYIGGAGLARGYWERPGLSDDRFRPDPFLPGTGARMYFTGDLARYRAGGEIEFLGRSDQQVKIRGHRIELGEIETAIAAHPSILEVVVVVREDVADDKRLVAYIVSHAPVAAADVRAHVAKSLPDYLVPSHVVLLDALPLTPNNKVDRRALPAPDRVAGPSQKPAALSGDLERQIAATWQEVIRSGEVGGDDNFFDIGGDSLLAAQVLSLLRSRVNPAVSLTDLFRFPTVRSLAAHLGGTGTSRITQSSDRARQRQDAIAQRRAARMVIPTGPDRR